MKKNWKIRYLREYLCERHLHIYNFFLRNHRKLWVIWRFYLCVDVVIVISWSRNAENFSSIISRDIHTNRPSQSHSATLPWRNAVWKRFCIFNVSLPIRLTQDRQLNSHYVLCQKGFQVLCVRKMNMLKIMWLLFIIWILKVLKKRFKKNCWT